MPFCIYSTSIYKISKQGYRITGTNLYSLYPLTYEQISDDIIVFFEGSLFNKKYLCDVARIGLDSSHEKIIASLYRNNGIAFLEMLNGYFGIVILSKKEDTIFVCHDRSNMEWVYYWLEKGAKQEFIISNNVHDILKFKKPAVNKDSLPAYFMWGHVEGGETLFEGVRKLDLFETIEYRNKNWKYERPGYQVLLSQQIKAGISVKTATSVIAEIMESQITEITDSYDCELSCLLSGGVDSSYLQALLLKHGFEKSYSCGYEGIGLRNKLALQSANVLGTSHFPWEMSADDLLSCMSEGIRNCGMPFVYFGEGLFMYMFKNISSSQGSPCIIFGGDFGDSIIGHGLDVYILRVYRLLRSAFGPLSDLVFNALIGRRFHDWNDLSQLTSAVTFDSSLVKKLLREGERVRKFLKLLGAFDENRLYESMSRLVNSSPGSLEDRRDRLRALMMGSMQRVLHTQYEIAKPYNITLIQPFSNPELIQFMFTVPNKQKVRNFADKYLEKRILSAYMPHKSVWTRKTSNDTPFKFVKQAEGFWKIMAEIKDCDYSDIFIDINKFISELIHDSELQGYLTGDLIHLVSFHMWYKIFIRGK